VRQTGRLLLLASVTLTIAISVPAVLLTDARALSLDNLQEVVASLGGALALLVAIPQARGRARLLRALLAASLGSAGLGQIVWDLAPSGSTPILGDVLLLGGAVVGMATILPAAFGGLSRDRLAGTLLDGLLLFFGGAGLVTVLVHADALVTGAWVGAFGAVVLWAAAGACVIALMSRRIAFSFSGPWAILAGGIVSGAAWLVWLEDPTVTSTVGPSDFMYSAGMLLLAYGAISWDPQVSTSRRYRRVARELEFVLPSAAILVAVSLGLLAVAPEKANLLRSIVSAVFIAAALRQFLLQASERSSREGEVATNLRLDAYRREREAVTASLASLESLGSVVETAQRICREALRLDGIDLATIRILNARGEVVPLALEGLDGRLDDLMGVALPNDRAAAIVARSRNGPWFELLVSGHDALTTRMADAGLCGTVNAPLLRDGHLIGVIGLGTTSAEMASMLGERLATADEFAMVAAALLGAALEEGDRREIARAKIRDIIDRGAFQPVFQPVIEIATGKAVGYEALTRFDDGLRPDHRFIEADAAGMGPALEIACLRAAVNAATDLPGNAWLSLNASPVLATDILTILEILSESRRAVVLEITEHVPVEDYDRLVGALGTLGGTVRVSVDDAGAGYAGLTHILALRPDFVKLDIALVRSLDRDPARRAMVTSMVFFARETGSELIAEGVETEAELAALRELGVTFVQGYLFGKPQGARSFAAASAA
jgi:EAL domain-containing protein (putative c-di-GMP-specific phosphodiesterase class I)